MDSRFSALPYSAQFAVEKCVQAMEREQRTLRAKQVIADRAQRHLEAADLRADELQAKMRHVKYAPRP